MSLSSHLPASIGQAGGGGRRPALGRERHPSDERDTLAQVVDGDSLCLFVWKLHNAVPLPRCTAGQVSPILGEPRPSLGRQVNSAVTYNKDCRVEESFDEPPFGCEGLPVGQGMQDSPPGRPAMGRAWPFLRRCEARSSRVTPTTVLCPRHTHRNPVSRGHPLSAPRGPATVQVRVLDGEAGAVGRPAGERASPLRRCDARRTRRSPGTLCLSTALSVFWMAAAAAPAATVSTTAVLLHQHTMTRCVYTVLVFKGCL